MAIQTTKWTLDHRWPCLRPGPIRDNLASARANSYWCPIGRQPGRGWVLMTRHDAKRIIDGGQTYHTLTIECRGSGPNTGRMDFPGLVIVKAECVGGDPTDDDAAYLIELADRRITAARLSTINSQYNVRVNPPFDDPRDKMDNLTANHFHEQTLDSSALWTWESMCEDIWGSVSGAMGSWPGMVDGAVAGEKYPQNVILPGVNAWDALTMALWYMRGNVVVYDPVADTTSIKSILNNETGAAVTGGATPLTGIEADLAAHPDTLMDADFLRPDHSRSPQKIKVHFMRQHLRGCADQMSDEDAWVTTEAVYTVTINTSLPDAVGGTVVDLWGNAPIYDDPSGNESTITDSRAQAIQLAKAWLGDHGLWQSGSSNDSDSEATLTAPYTYGRPTHRIYQGLAHRLRPGVFIKAMTWRDHGDGLMTEAAYHYGPPEPLDEVGGLPDIEWAAREWLEPPDFHRRSYPQRLDIFQPVQIDDGSSTDGAEVAPTGTLIWDGKHLLIGDSADDSAVTVTEGDDIYVGDLDRGRALPQGQRMLARYAGAASVSSTVKPLYVAQYRAGHYGIRGSDTTNSFGDGGDPPAEVQISIATVST